MDYLDASEFKKNMMNTLNRCTMQSSDTMECCSATRTRSSMSNLSKDMDSEDENGQSLMPSHQGNRSHGLLFEIRRVVLCSDDGSTTRPCRNHGRSRAIRTNNGTHIGLNDRFKKG